MRPLWQMRGCLACLVAAAVTVACVLAMKQFGDHLAALTADLVRTHLLQQQHDLRHEFQLRDDSHRVRVLCWIMTQPQNYNSNVKAVNATWAPRCDGYFFLSSESDTKPPSGLPVVAMKVKEGREYLWDKTQAAFIHIYQKHLNDYDFFLKADDDSFIVLENLRLFLSGTDPSQPVFAGRRFRPFTKQGYMSGGGGYVLSRGAVRLLVEKAFKASDKQCRKHGGPEDVNMGVCLEYAGVRVLDSIDLLGRERFNPLDVENLIHLDNLPKDYWLRSYNYHPMNPGLECCSSSAISFHYVKPAHMLMLNYLIYQLRAHGVFPNSAARVATGRPLHQDKLITGRI